jgi:benzoate transport
MDAVATSDKPSLQELVSRSPMSMHQIGAVLVCMCLNMLDGFDILVMSFTASGVSAEWKLSGGELGVLLSAGLVGMAAGSLFLAPRADRFGRRTIIITSVIIVSVGMLLSGFTRSYVQLAVLRAVTGVGIGGILAGATVLVAEYASSSWRSTASYLYTSGYSIGGTLGGAVAAALIGRHGWRAAFQFGGLISVAMLPVVLWRLPESIDFLITRQPAHALQKLNRLLRKMNHALIEVLPAAVSPVHGSPGASVQGLFAKGLLRPTMLLWIAFFFMMGGYYFVFSWTPKLLTAAGQTAQQGITAGVLLSLGGIVGTVVFAFIARVVTVGRLVTFCLLVASMLMVLFALNTADAAVGLLAGVALGGMSTSAMAGFYALTPVVYPPQLRSTGMGWAIGIGRIGAILAPLATGLLVDRGWQTVQLYWAFAATFVVAGVACACLLPARVVIE